MYNAHLVCYQISLWDSHRSEISGLQTERAVSRHSKSDLSLEGSNWESLHNSLGWTGLDLDLLAEHELGSSLCGWLDTGLDPAEAWDGEDASLLDLTIQDASKHRLEQGLLLHLSLNCMELTIEDFPNILYTGAACRLDSTYDCYSTDCSHKLAMNSCHP